MDKLLDDPALADHFGVTTRTLRAWRYEGRPLPPGIKIGGGWRYRQADVERWFAEQLAHAAEPVEATAARGRPVGGGGR